MQTRLGKEPVAAATCLACLSDLNRQMERYHSTVLLPLAVPLSSPYDLSSPMQCVRVFREAEFAEGMLQTLAQYAEQLNLKHAKAAAASAPRTAPPVATTLAIDTADIKARLHHAVTKANELAAKQLKLQHLFDRYCDVSARFVPPACVSFGPRKHQGVGGSNSTAA